MRVLSEEISAALPSAGQTWWDEGFTQLLVRSVPSDTRHLVEMDCGLARAGHLLLPYLPSATYVGVESDAERLAQAQQLLVGASFASRVSLRLGKAEELPLPDGMCDVVLSIMDLQQHPDVPAVLREARRVLRNGGRIVAVAPDNLGQRFYFDGVLEEVSDVVHRLCLRARAACQPVDLAVGPRMPGLLQAAGLLSVSMTAHAIHSSRSEDAKTFFNRLRRVCQGVVEHAGLPPELEELQICEAAITRAQFAGLPKRVGFSAHVVPAFCVVGINP